ncbi:MAG: class I SAM-dependent methyltransferase [Verrucomicrobiales bacterium]|nr:class I SAM-dependent methyltransferase [Verrucomicrobiales bacterium]
MRLNPQPTPDTNAWRIHHDADAGVWIDHFDGRWLVQTRSGRFPDGVEALADGIATSIYWRPRDLDAATEPTHRWGEVITEPFQVEENGARFEIDFSAGYSPGIFLDQRENRLLVREKSRSGTKVLNAFAYTGAFSVMAALGGAETSTLDLSKTYLDWTWRNFALNRLNREDHHGCKGDAFEWLATFARQGREFDGVILDPPTFSRHKKKTFKTDRDYASLAELAAKLTKPGGWMLCCANTHKLYPGEYQRQVEEGIRAAGRNVLNLKKKPMPTEFNGDDYLKSLWVDVG